MKQNRSTLFLGLLLIALGAWMVVTRQVPSIQAWLNQNFLWPIWLFGAGAIILLIGLVNGNPGMAIPAAIVAGIGGILYYQELNHDYSSWAYMWTLIPGFVGVGSILAGLLGENTSRNIGHGLNQLFISAVLFLIFASFLGGLDILGAYGAPVILILLGVYVLARGFLRSARRGGNNETA
jgi:hypothetical protein